MCGGFYTISVGWSRVSLFFGMNPATLALQEYAMIAYREWIERSYYPFRSRFRCRGWFLFGLIPLLVRRIHL